MTSVNNKLSRRSRSAPRSLGNRIFLGCIGVVGVLYLGLAAYHYSVPQKPSEELSEESLLELCRQTCLNYGLLPTGHVADDAKALLAATGPEQLTGAIVEILGDQDFSVAESEPHVLREKPAPDFKAPDVNGSELTLREIAGGRPVVMVFYYGYNCSHCVEQLFAINRDLPYFRQLDAEVVALSSDSPEHTAAQYGKYGKFDFPVLSDAKNGIAEKYGVFRRAGEGVQESLQHGTFVIDSGGKVIWAYQGGQPFLDNKSLLYVLAKSQGVLPKKRPKNVKIKFTEGLVSN